MVIDNLHDFDLVGAVDGLGEFVVIDQDKLAIHIFEEVGLGDDANGPLGHVHHGEGQEP